MDSNQNIEPAKLPPASLRSRITKWVAYQLKMLPHRPRLGWARAWLRKDEFHPSLEMDVDAMLDMSEADKKRYREDLVRRRNLAHEKDLGAWY